MAEGCCSMDRRSDRRQWLVESKRCMVDEQAIVWTSSTGHVQEAEKHEWQPWKESAC